MKLRPCKYLDYTKEDYPSCELVDLSELGFPGVKHWKRVEELKNNTGNLVNVQFCKLRGRINSIFDCYEIGVMSCYCAGEEKEKI